MALGSPSLHSTKHSWGKAWWRSRSHWCWWRGTSQHSLPLPWQHRLRTGQPHSYQHHPGARTTPMHCHHQHQYLHVLQASEWTPGLHSLQKRVCWLADAMPPSCSTAPQEAWKKSENSKACQGSSVSPFPGAERGGWLQGAWWADQLVSPARSQFLQQSYSAFLMTDILLSYNLTKRRDPALPHTWKSTQLHYVTKTKFYLL